MMSRISERIGNSNGPPNQDFASVDSAFMHYDKYDMYPLTGEKVVDSVLSLQAMTKTIEERLIMTDMISTPYDNMRFFKAHHTPIFEKITEDGEIYVGVSDRPWVYMKCTSDTGLRRLIEDLPVQFVNFALVEDWMVDIVARDYVRTREMVCKRLYLPENVLLPEVNAEVCMLDVTEALTAWIADRLRKDGYAVYVHIEVDNIKSMTLAKKMGFVEDRNVRWFTLEEAK